MTSLGAVVHHARGDGVLRDLLRSKCVYRGVMRVTSCASLMRECAPSHEGGNSSVDNLKMLSFGEKVGSI